MLLSLSFAIHLAVDNTQRENLFFYFLFYRAKKKFDARILTPEFDFSTNAALDKK